MRFWVGVVSGEHVARGYAGGFMQVCHGKVAPLRRIAQGDGMVYYSPTQGFRGTDKLQSFTAIGIVRAGEPYAFDMGGGFVPHRRDVAWWPAQITPIRPLLDDLDFTRNDRNWGYKLRFGLFDISGGDFERIAVAMQAQRAEA